MLSSEIIHILIFLSDWPDLSSDTDSERSEVEAIIGGDEGSPPHPGAPSSPPTMQQSLTELDDRNKDPTAQQIMSLLNELGHSNIVEESSQLEHDVYRCVNCVGRPMIV